MKTCRVNSRGSIVWCRDGKRHREDGPAIVHPDGREEWWVNGELTPPPGEKP